MIIWFKNGNEHFHCTENDAKGIEEHLAAGYEVVGFVHARRENWKEYRDEWKYSDQVWMFWFVGRDYWTNESTPLVHD